MNIKLKEIGNILNIVILVFSLIWVAGLYISFVAIIANKVIPRFTIYNLLFRVVSIANVTVIINMGSTYINSRIDSKLMRVIVVILFTVLLLILIVGVFSFLNIWYFYSFNE